jgi:hypothetical protein
LALYHVKRILKDNPVLKKDRHSSRLTACKIGLWLEIGGQTFLRTLGKSPRPSSGFQAASSYNSPVLHWEVWSNFRHPNKSDGDIPQVSGNLQMGYLERDFGQPTDDSEIALPCFWIKFGLAKPPLLNLIRHPEVWGKIDYKSKRIPRNPLYIPFLLEKRKKVEGSLRK